MNYASAWLSKLFFGDSVLTLSETAVSLAGRDTSKTITYLDLTQVECSVSLFWYKVGLRSEDSHAIFRGVSKHQAEAIVAEITQRAEDAVHAHLKSPGGVLEQLAQITKPYVRAKKYLANKDIERLFDTLVSLKHNFDHPFFNSQKLASTDRQGVIFCEAIVESDRATLKKLNDRFVLSETERFRSLFDALEEFPLSDEQTDAVITNEDRTLLIAAAGSGKTATIVAKAIYLIAAGLAKPHELLILAYNKDAQLELEARLKSLEAVVPEYQTCPTVRTFHGFGYEVLSHVTEKRPKISPFATAGRKGQAKYFSELVRDLYSSDEQFANAWQQFILVDKQPLLDIFKIKTQKEYDSYLAEIGRLRGRSVRASDIVVPTIDGKEVKSVEEARIANWLAINGVEYVYEARYQSSEEDRVDDFNYHPDFYYPEPGVYHEHFAIDKNGKTPPFISDDYLDGIAWKRNLHAERKTTLIETHSAHFADGTVFDRLERQLIEQGVPLKPLGEEAITELLAQAFDPDVDGNLFLTFLSHYKANQVSSDRVGTLVSEMLDKERGVLFLTLFEKIYQVYTAHLEQGGEIDFQDQINLACSALETGSFRHGFKYVLVDEFQDTSQDRKRLLTAILSQDVDTKLFAVGDDWQSIYRFAGSDIDIMTRFESHFGHTATRYLTQTYRSFGGIVKTAADFIQANKEQIRKTVKAIKNSDKDQIIIHGYKNANEHQAKLNGVLTRLNELNFDGQLSVYLLARYAHQQPQRVGHYRNLDIQFSTIHASKGLQADYVIMLNVESGEYGFPSNIADDPLLGLVMPNPEHYPHAEERRLMYVAMTRAKRAVFILSNQQHVSPFVRELSEMDGVNTERLAIQRKNPCPKCDVGELMERWGKYGPFSACSNYPTCAYSKSLKGNRKSGS